MKKDLGILASRIGRPKVLVVWAVFSLLAAWVAVNVAFPKPGESILTVSYRLNVAEDDGWAGQLFTQRRLRHFLYCGETARLAGLRCEAVPSLIDVFHNVASSRLSNYIVSKAFALTLREEKVFSYQIEERPVDVFNIKFTINLGDIRAGDLSPSAIDSFDSLLDMWMRNYQLSFLGELERSIAHLQTLRNILGGTLGVEALKHHKRLTGQLKAVLPHFKTLDLGDWAREVEMTTNQESDTRFLGLALIFFSLGLVMWLGLRLFLKTGYYAGL